MMLVTAIDECCVNVSVRPGRAGWVLGIGDRHLGRDNFLSVAPAFAFPSHSRSIRRTTHTPSDIFAYANAASDRRTHREEITNITLTHFA
jgi:hypothetical protein